ncbi:MAG TPA: GDP-mannose 4,6-dehydratase [Gemmatimonadales bacterium]|nr:GDP-mannose 4,6-dehydratase [Gemmatimonadales bacterium]
MSAWRGRKVFVSGAAGLLGSWMAEELLRRGADVTCLIRDWVPNSRAITDGVLDRCQVVRGDLEDFAVVLRTLNEYEIDSIFHLGAQAIVGTANRSPLSTFESNIRGTWTLLEAARQCPRLIERIVVASSDKAYGAHDTLPYTERTPLLGRFPYDVSKACGDLIALSYAETYELPLAVTRCGNLYGGGDLNFSRLIPGTIRSALRGEPPLIRSDGTFVRDYFFVRDAVNAYLHLAERLPAPGIVGEAFNLGPETPLSVLEVVDRVLTAMGRRDLEPVVLNEARHEIPHQYLDCAKARERLDWKPEFSFEQGLRETIEWYRTWLAA